MGGKVHRGHEGELEEVLDDDLWRPRVAPGRTSITQRLPPRPQVLFRVADPAMARTIAIALEPRDRNGVARGADEAVDRAAGGSGSMLRDDLRQRFEGSLGADLSSVRVHTGAESATAAGAVGARAYTVGQDIHFADGQYRPDDPWGVHLLAHEVAHTVQQAGGSTQRQHKLDVSGPQDAAEVEADRAADAMVSGQRAEVTGGPTIAARDKDPNAAAPADPAKEAQEQQNKGKPAKVVNNIKEVAGGSIEYDAPTYFDLYTQAKAREDGGLEAGSCELSEIKEDYKPDASGQVTATFTGTIKVNLPKWKQYATASKEEKAKFDTWVASVKVHEDKHAKIIKDGYAKLSTEVKGPTEAECGTQFDKVHAQVKTDQTTFDADKSKQPAPLPAPGGIIKVPSSGVPPKKNDTDGAATDPAGAAAPQDPAVAPES